MALPEKSLALDVVATTNSAPSSSLSNESSICATTTLLPKRPSLLTTIPPANPTTSVPNASPTYSNWPPVSLAQHSVSPQMTSQPAPFAPAELWHYFAQKLIHPPSASSAAGVLTKCSDTSTLKQNPLCVATPQKCFNLDNTTSSLDQLHPHLSMSPSSTSCHPLPPSLFHISPTHTTRLPFPTQSSAGYLYPCYMWRLTATPPAVWLRGRFYQSSKSPVSSTSSPDC